MPGTDSKLLQKEKKKKDYVKAWNSTLEKIEIGGEKNYLVIRLQK